MQTKKDGSFDYGVICVFLGFCCSQALAQSGRDYLLRLGQMQRYLESSRSFESLASDSPLHLARQFYEPGDKWSVELHLKNQKMARKTELDHLKNNDSTQAIEVLTFDYHVKKVDSSGIAHIEVHLRANPQGPFMDHSVDFLVIEVDRSFTVIAKKIHLKDSRTFTALPSAGFELYPVDLPNAKDLVGQNPMEFRSQDLFGRSIRTLWSEGEKWPSRVETTVGVAILRPFMPIYTH